MSIERHSISKGSPDAPHVVCLHGLLGSARALLKVVDAIAAAGFHAVAYDQLGHGHSPHATKLDEYSAPNLARDAFSVMDAHHIDRAHLVGHSMGARVSLAATAIEPERIKSLTMLDAGVRTTAEARQELRDVIEPLPGSYASRAEAEQDLSKHGLAMKQFLLSNLRIANRDPRQRLSWMFDLNGARSYLLDAITLDQSETWRKVRCPTLLARGERSTSLPEADFNDMLRLNPRAKGVVIPNAGHWVHVDNLKGTVDAVTSFLKSVES